ncbi:MAG: ubiquinol-cytochrome c reductase iron-sulfur subunit [Betaproteobacteria bacterium]|nr:ubiquinol-cytochrome c reductase iron-sulfur subunit [Betaproteobacteria bacterium]MDE2047105.1 ubiquinol-cytochrome c reductase iron-sulfur subunit [Betaproteobacteria bacterium]
MSRSVTWLRPAELSPDEHRRRLLLATTTGLGVAGLAATAYPFLDSMEPSARALAEGGPVSVDLSTFAEGEMRTVAWRSKPVWILRRSPAVIAALQQPNSALLDPLSRHSVQPPGCDNATRSLKPEWLVAVGICTHLGCIPLLHWHDAALNAELHAPGGYLCPCHGSRFDLAARVVKNVPAPTNLEIPPYRFTGPAEITIG